MSLTWKRIDTVPVVGVGQLIVEWRKSRVRAMRYR